VCEGRTLKSELKYKPCKELRPLRKLHTKTFIISILNIQILEESYEGKFRGLLGYLARIIERNVLKIFRFEMPLEWKDLRDEKVVRKFCHKTCFECVK